MLIRGMVNFANGLENVKTNICIMKKIHVLKALVTSKLLLKVIVIKFYKIKIHLRIKQGVDSKQIDRFYF